MHAYSVREALDIKITELIPGVTDADKTFIIEKIMVARSGIEACTGKGMSGAPIVTPYGTFTWSYRIIGQIPLVETSKGTLVGESDDMVRISDVVKIVFGVDKEIPVQEK